MIDYILATTTSDTLTYIGHSQSNILMLALMSENDHYQQLVKPFIALSPTWHLTHVRSNLVFFNLFEPYLKLSPGPLVFHDMKTVRSVLSTLCSNRMIRWICYQIYDMSVGYQPSDIRLDRFPVHIYNIPSGASNDNAIHHMQTWRTGRVSHYDHGLEKNLLLYNQSEPPLYNVSRINSAHMAFFQASHDRISSIEGNIQLKQQLSTPLLEDYVINRTDFDHMSFVWSKHAGILVNEKILQLLSLYENDNQTSEK
ncbi:Alpha/beta-hydrolase lipase region, variant 3 [Dermatophagoides farinae]|uniref:Alpha/beta-hydrolase lipase region, variant 3 n=1 Tax=Dermatophagoides farinae TaxID=6954 RepID=A0A922IFW3_DERFA|nr:Alpha/beta-hydrolase lipase region, variant 3 [Dermatophagoides farinae]